MGSQLGYDKFVKALRLRWSSITGRNQQPVILAMSWTSTYSMLQTSSPLTTAREPLFWTPLWKEAKEVSQGRSGRCEALKDDAWIFWIKISTNPTVAHILEYIVLWALINDLVKMSRKTLVGSVRPSGTIRQPLYIRCKGIRQPLYIRCKGTTQADMKHLAWRAWALP